MPKKKKPALKKKKNAAKKPVKTAKKTAGEKAKRSPKKTASKKSISRSRQFLNEAAPMDKGPGERGAGQAGDIEGLSGAEEADSESVAELVEEGQDYEAEIVDAVENAPDPDEGELTTDVPEDDIDPAVRSFSKRNRL
jgi:hypothetical protein